MNVHYIIVSLFFFFDQEVLFDNVGSVFIETVVAVSADWVSFLTFIGSR
jgi:hypothetical protein